jgi:glycosyltransferase involved in cell wall biosynthesis
MVLAGWLEIGAEDMSVTPVISVVIPNYNNGSLLAAAIESALNQTFRAVEIVVVDDGSTDDSRQVIERYRPPIQAIFQPNRGPAAARNAGIRAACGEYIQFLDADDLLLPHALERLVAMAWQHPEAGIVSGGAVIRCMATGEETIQLPGKAEGWVFTEMIADNLLITSATLARRVILLQAGLFDEDRTLQVVEDYDMWLRVAKVASFFFVREPLIVRRIHAANLSTGRLTVFLKEVRVFRKWLARENDGRVRRLIRRKLRRLYHELAYLARTERDGPNFRRFARLACLSYPIYWKNWAYLVWSCLWVSRKKNL